MIERDNSTIDRRYFKLLLGLGVAALILLGRVFYIQVIDDKYKESALNNAKTYETIYPTRGIIYDRNGKILVGNKGGYDIIVTPKDVEAFDTLLLAQTLGTTEEFIRTKFKEMKGSYQQLVLMKQVPPEQYMEFTEIEYKFKGFRGVFRSLREYPINAGGNLLGYVSEVDGDYINRHPGVYRPGDYAGKTGIEAAMEEQLRGEKGYKVFLRNAKGQIESRFNEGLDDKEAIPGHNVYTTIDADLQQYGQQLMNNKLGSVVAIEPATGEILAMVSSPGIDVSMLADIRNHYNEIARNPNKPMFNRAVQASYPPGSVFKLVNGLIGLEEGVLTPSTRYPCSQGYHYGNNKKLGCHSHPSPLDLDQAIMMSCNGYFCYVLKSILENKKYKDVAEALDAWNAYVQSFGFGHKLGSDFPSELGGNLPTSAYYNRIYRKGGWRFSTILSISIGQGEVGVTPLQIANLAATVANRGYYITPHIIKDSEGVEIDPKYHEKQRTLVGENQFKKVIHGMWRAVNSGPGSGGTASVAAVPGLDICGKTGTAQVPRGKDNSVFICFAPENDPKIAIAAYVEHGGFGATWAAPIASLMVEKYLNGSVERVDLEKRILDGNLMSNTR